MMEDYITREVSKTTAAIEAILKEIVPLVEKKVSSAEIHDCVKTELAGRLGLDIDTVL